MGNNQDQFTNKLEALKKEYTSMLPTRLDEIDDVWGELHKGNSLETQHLLHLVHSLAGSGTTFGYSQLSKAAKNLEALIRQINAGNYAALTNEINEAVQYLRKKAAHVDEQDLTGAFKLGIEKSGRHKHVQEIIWYSQDLELSKKVKQYLRKYGFNTHVYNEVAQIFKHLDENDVNLLVFDFYNKAGTLTDVANMNLILDKLHTKVPFICICPPGDDLANWLSSFRHGASCCYTKPINLQEILDKVDTLTEVKMESPYRVFMIDDDVKLLKHAALILEKAGMIVEGEPNPTKALLRLESFKPDLILLDVHMPSCSGLDLARIIRQDKAYLGVPIVYLSQETEINKKLEAFDAGADDFLFKPVKYRTLYHVLSARIRRSRQLRSFTDHDSLTGIFNHTAIQDRLTEEVRRASRKEQALSFVLLDLDDFKSLNEKYSHAAGDLALQSVAILLKRHVNKRASVGRYGGEEFAIILPGYNQEQAERLVEAIRKQFSQIIHETTYGTFQETFSAGIASFPGFNDAGKLAEAAANALANAKITGKNKVVSLDPVPETNDNTDKLIVDISNDLIFLEDEDDDTEFVPLIEDDEEIEAAYIETENTGPLASIMVVDDDPQILSHISTVLEEKGFEVYQANTGDAGYEKALKKNPDLVLIDLLLFPGIHGFELCQKIRQNPSLSGTKIILMTAVYKDYRYRLEGKEAGANDFIEKPINYPELFAKISEQLPYLNL